MLPRVARVSPAVASGVRALRSVTGRPAAEATVSRRRALSGVASPGRRATTTRTDRSSRRSTKAASQRRVSWSAQWASSTISTSGQSRRASRLHRGDQSVAHALRVGLPLPRVGYAESGAA